MSYHVEQARLSTGVFINRLYDSGLIFALAISLLINGRAALYIKDDGKPLAQFLNSAIKILSPDPVIAGWSLISFGAILLAVMMCGILLDKPLFGLRVVLAFIGMAIYIAISAAIRTSMEPAIAAERYEAPAALFFLAFVVNLSRFVASRQSRGVK